MKKEYIIEIQTGSLPSAGTDAAVYIQFIHGQQRSNELRLDNKGKDDFVRGHTDSFTVYADDIGWIDQIRLFHDNSNEGPGWFVNSVKVMDKQIGLTWNANFYRWLAVNEGDHATDVTCDVPIEVTLGDGVLQSFYTGYELRCEDNYHSSLPKEVKDAFKSTYKRGVWLDESSTTSVKTGAEVGFKFFASAKFTSEVTYAVASKIGSTQEEVLEHMHEYAFTLPPGQAQSVVAVYYQGVLRGKLTANDVGAEYEQKFDVNSDLIYFDGRVSKPEVEAYIVQLLETTTGADIQPITSEVSRIPLAQVSVPQVDKASLEMARRNLPQHIVDVKSPTR